MEAWLMLADIFKPILDGGMVEFWAMETLQDWFQVYTEELELQRIALGMPDQRGSHPLPRSYHIAEELDKEAADQLPAIVLVCPGTNGQPPKKDGRGQYRATWMLGVGLFVSANTREATKDLVRFYAAVVRAILVQKPSLGGHAFRTTWLDESYDDNYLFPDTQTISAGQVIFEVEVDNVVTHGAGPVTPPDPPVQPGSENHRVEHVIIDLKKEPLV